MAAERGAFDQCAPASCHRGDKAFVEDYLPQKRSAGGRSVEIHDEIAYRLRASESVVADIRIVLAAEAFVAVGVDGATIASARPERHFVEGVAVTSASVEHRGSYAPVSGQI